MKDLFEIDMYLHTAPDTHLQYEVLKDFHDTYDFGTIQIKTNQTTATTEPIAVFFTVDDSGSMTDNCSDGRTKMQHIKHTLTRILQLFSQHTGHISVAVEAFDSHVKPVFDLVEITTTNVNELVEKVVMLTPCDMTNLETALFTAKEKIEKFQETNPSYKMVHILLTDGFVTVGEGDAEELKTLISPNYSNIFIGFGLEHDSVLLQTLASSEINEYRVIDKLEKAGFVYGEVVHQLLFPAIERVRLSSEIDGIELYDYKQNRWVKELRVPRIAGVGEKTFHFRVAKECLEVPEILFQCRCMDERGINVVEVLDVMPDLLTEVSENIFYRHTTDLTKYMFRQKTQELLYECKEFNNRLNRRIPYPFGLNKGEEEETADPSIKRDLYKRLKRLYLTINAYASDESKNDLFIRELLDDIYIVYYALGKEASITSARQTSQGRGDSYRVNITSKNQPHIFESVEDEAENPFLTHVTLDNTENTSTQEQIMQIMRECSQ